MDSQELITAVFAFLEKGSDTVMTEAELRLANEDYMTLQCGGPGNIARPATGSYDVLIDHDPPRFWKRYGDRDALVYSAVPSLLIRHHVTRHGGIAVVRKRVVRTRHKSDLLIGV